ncbi:MAG TPA: hypothetical protein DDZ11_00485 [Lentisphaeria bacterium]|nr:hypothetical protein [Lentisphaeria bacterium]
MPPRSRRIWKPSTGPKRRKRKISKPPLRLRKGRRPLRRTFSRPFPPPPRLPCSRWRMRNAHA